MDRRGSSIPTDATRATLRGHEPLRRRHHRTRRRGLSTLPATLRLGPVHLTVTDLDRSVAWYQAALGLRVHRHEVDAAALGDGSDRRPAPPRGRPGRASRAATPASTTTPCSTRQREELARAALRLAATRTPIQGASDHGTHEAIYLPDPDGNGIELAADRPREQWPTPEEEFSGGGPRPLDFDALLATVAGEDAEPRRSGPACAWATSTCTSPTSTQGLAFYRDVIGFDVWALMPTAAFVAAGGYHHHLGFNTWRGEGIGAVAGGRRRRPAPLDDRARQRPDEVAAVRERLRAAGIDVAPTSPAASRSPTRSG